MLLSRLFLDIFDRYFSFTGGYLGSEYKLAQFHLHWGDDFRGGSEHTVDGRRYFSEVHFVHFNSDRHTGLTAEALADGEGLAVLGYFIDAGLVRV